MSTAKENERFLFLPLFKTFNFGWVEKYLSYFKNMKIIPNMLGEEKAAIHYFSTINQHKKICKKSVSLFPFEFENNIFNMMFLYCILH